MPRHTITPLTHFHSHFLSVSPVSSYYYYLLHKSFLQRLPVSLSILSFFLTLYPFIPFLSISLTCLFVLLLSSTQVFSSKASCVFVYSLIFSDSLSFYSFLIHIPHVSVCITIIFYTSLFFNAFLCVYLLITALFLSLHCFYILLSTNLLLR